MSEDIFKKACLVKLTCRCWSGKRALPGDTMSAVGDREWLNGTKKLVRPGLIRPIRAVVASARRMLRDYALPFPIQGLTLVPKTAMERIEARLQDHKLEFDGAVDSFLFDYEEAVHEARELLGELFDATDYPMDIRGCFEFAWQYVSLDKPDKASLLSPEMMKREEEKFRNLMAEAKTEAMTALREGFRDLVDGLARKLEPGTDGRPKSIKSNSLNRLREFTATFDDRNIFNDEELHRLVDRMKSLTDGVDGTSLRDDPSARRAIRDGMEGIMAGLDGMVEDAPARRVRL